MSNERINLDDYVDDLPLGVASYRNKIKIVLKDFAKELLELAAENANLSISSRGVETYFDNFYSGVDNVEVNKQSILDTIKQVE